jgi:uncharacterized protein YndB with AHSA1/START domain
MSASVLQAHERLLPNRARSAKEQGRDQHIAITTKVNADRRRIFDALTLPEYMETWFCLPGSDSASRLAASHTGDRYCLERFAAGGVDICITGSYHVCRRGKLLFTWKKSTSPVPTAIPETNVSIRLLGAFTQSTVCLYHTGCFSEGEFLWHQEMWNLSLDKLRLLF